MATKKTPKQPKPKKFEALIKKALEYNPNKTGSVKVYSNNKSKQHKAGNQGGENPSPLQAH